MKCNICNHKILDKNEKITLKKGCICKKCLAELPKPMQGNVEKYTAAQVNYLKNIMYISKEDRPWILSENGVFGLGTDYVCLKGYAFPLSEIESFRLVFCPLAEGKSANTAIGTVTIELTLKKYKTQLRCLWFEHRVTVPYSITKDDILYHFPKNIAYWVNVVTEAVKKGEDFSKIKVEFEHKKKAREEATRRAKEEADRKRQEQRRRQEQAYREQQRRQEQAYRENQKRRQEYREDQNREEQYHQRRTSTNITLKEAEALFQMSTPFTKEQIRKKRNILLKKNHPDEGGSPEMCKKINLSYEVLLKAAS